MEVFDRVTELRTWRAGAAAPVGLVPTMGALHEGHLSHVRRARGECRTLVVSVFVNPLQFGPGEDLDAYPRDLPGDLRQLQAQRVDAVFAPPAEAFTPRSLGTTVRVSGLTEHLEGASRPGHFDGVSTIVAKLFNVVQPDRAYFGEKDYQQLAVIRRMVADLDLPVVIVGGRTVRDPDGLALSSRNAYLSAEDRGHALGLSRALRQAATGWTGDADAARARLRAELGGAPGVRLDYAEVVDPLTLVPLAGAGHERARAVVAAWVGPARLIDNAALGPEGEAERSEPGGWGSEGEGERSEPGGWGSEGEGERSEPGGWGSEGSER